MRRIDKTVAEPLLRMAITSLFSAADRLAAMSGHASGTNERKASKLSTAQKRIAEAATMIQDYATANEIELRTQMNT